MHIPSENLQLIGDMIKTASKGRKLTQYQLGNLIGVKKAQISRLENNTSNVTTETILKVFHAIEAKVKLLNNRYNRQNGCCFFEPTILII